MNRRFRLLLAAVACAALLWLLLAAAERALALAQRFLGLPVWLQWMLGALLVLFALAAVFVLWWLLRPRKRKRRAPQAPTREDLDARIDRLGASGHSIEPLSSELHELDARRASGRLYVAVFGEISAGKSSLIAALAPDARIATDVRGGTTREVAHYDTALADGRALTLADVPGSREAGGESREAMARAEVLRAHVVIYVTGGDLNRPQGEEVAWLAEFGKPLLLALNKADLLTPDEREQLLERLRDRAPAAASIVAISAGGSERFERRLADGRSEQVQRHRAADIAPLLEALTRLLDRESAQLEPAREQAVLASVHERTSAAEIAMRQHQAEAVVRRYTRRAVVGAMAAVAPGSDLIIQGALATAMTRALGRVYAIPISDVQIEDFLKQARMTLRTSASIVLAIAGNALKAFPGLGTLGGGVLHAFAYALIFDSLGKALSATLAERQTLDQDAAGEHLKELLGKAGHARLKRLATLTVDAVRTGDDKSDRDEAVY